MQVKKLRLAYLSLFFLNNSFALAPTVTASNYYRTRQKTLRRIAKNVALAAAIDKIYQHPELTSSQQILLKSIPLFIDTRFNKESMTKLKDGTKLTAAELSKSLTELKVVLLKISKNEPKYPKSLEKVLEAIHRVLVSLDKAR